MPSRFRYIAEPGTLVETTCRILQGRMLPLLRKSLSDHRICLENATRFPQLQTPPKATEVRRD